jgi:hypothetical protein
VHEMVLSLTTDLEEGIGPKHSCGRRETYNLLRRARSAGSKVEVVLHPWPGCNIRRKPPEVAINPPPRPSEAAMLQKIRPAFRLLMHLDFAKLLKLAVSINIVCDGKQFGAQHTVGTVICIYTRDTLAETKDAFGNITALYTVVRMLMSRVMCRQQAPNKIAVDVVNSKNEKYVQQSSLLCLRLLVLSFEHDIFLLFM